MSESMPDLPVQVYISADSRSGSTLLDLLLSNHSAIVSVGELRRLHQHFNGYFACTCEREVSRCPYWRAVESKLQAQGHSLREMQTLIDFSPLALADILYGLSLVNLRRIGARLSFVAEAIEIAENQRVVINAVANATQRRFVVDSSKVPKAARLSYLLNPGAIRVVFLSRDGRGVISSRLRGTNASTWRCVLGWMAYTIKASLLKATLPDSSYQVLKYEDLCENPQRELGVLCSFLGLPYEPAMARLNKHDKHNICGSPMRFVRDQTEIRVDERWHSSLTARQLRTFRWLGGAWLNRRLGYQ